MADIKTQRNMVAILRVLRASEAPLGSQRIAEVLRSSGMDLCERAVRNYLTQADQCGWTRNLGRRGRLLTADGRREVEGALVVDKVGFVAARVDALAYQMSFDIQSQAGSVILNISTLSAADAPGALRAMRQVFEANLGMGRFVCVVGGGGRVGDFTVPADRVAIGTMCSVTINGVFLRAGIPTRSRFGGLLELEHGRPKRFTQIINYDGTSLDPLEIFIRGHMTSVAQAARTGSGLVGASFREVPSVALPEVQRLAKLSEKIGLGGLLAIGAPNQPLLDIPVSPGCAGLVVAGGLNPISAIVENGIHTTSAAMHSLCDFGELGEYKALGPVKR